VAAEGVVADAAVDDADKDARDDGVVPGAATAAWSAVACTPPQAGSQQHGAASLTRFHTTTAKYTATERKNMSCASVTMVRASIALMMSKTTRQPPTNAASGEPPTSSTIAITISGRKVPNSAER
jgi:hypothetical protein